MEKKEFLTLREACEWASSYIGRKVTPSNISYLIQYGKVLKYDESGRLKQNSKGIAKLSKRELMDYYDSIMEHRRRQWTEKLGEDINWRLGFTNIREAERTKHVHRLHPYKGKFITQLVEYFIDGHTDDFKPIAFFKQGDIILDPFAGSGTTLVQCLELGLHSIGIDISAFNCMIAKAKIQTYDIKELNSELNKALKSTLRFSKSKYDKISEAETDALISGFNKKYFPNPEFKILIGRLRRYKSKLEREVNKSTFELDYESKLKITEQVLEKYKLEKQSLEREICNLADFSSVNFEFEITPLNLANLVNEFTDRYEKAALTELNSEDWTSEGRKQEKLTALSNYEIPKQPPPFTDSVFLSQWFTENERLEMKHYLDLIDRQVNPDIQNLMRIILSRTARSCRATKHIDLATLVQPQFKPYYCRKHFKICRPVNTITQHLKRYTKDTIKRIRQFSLLRKDVFCEVINSDSRNIDILDYFSNEKRDLQTRQFYKLLKDKKIDGVFTSPPYVGQIDYHEQHAYAYELFNVPRRDDLEIGSMSNGASQQAQRDYVVGISKVMINIKSYLKKDAEIFVVANDSRKLYPEIVKKSGFRIVETFERPVLNRTERDKQPYSESIFHMRAG